MSGEPVVDALTLQAMERMPGATAEEIAESVIHLAESGGRPWSTYDRRVASERVHQIVNTERRRPRPTLDEIDAARAELRATGQAYGSEAIAKRIDSSATTIERVKRESRAER